MSGEWRDFLSTALCLGSGAVAAAGGEGLGWIPPLQEEEEELSLGRYLQLMSSKKSETC